MNQRDRRTDVQRNWPRKYEFRGWAAIDKRSQLASAFQRFTVISDLLDTPTDGDHLAEDHQASHTRNQVWNWFVPLRKECPHDQEIESQRPNEPSDVERHYF